jgi:hypothetical protein
LILISVGYAFGNQLFKYAPRGDSANKDIGIANAENAREAMSIDAMADLRKTRRGKGFIVIY